MKESESTFLFETSTAKFFRTLKSGKAFMLKAPKSDAGLHTALIRREFEIASSLDHPHIAGAYFIDEDTGGIVMEFVDGESLSEFLSHSPSKGERRRILSQILDAVSYMHKCGIVHNDLKPSNIMVSRKDSSAKIIDFGLSDSDAFYLATTMGCTQEYASPELLSYGKAGEKKQKIDARSDIYSLGKIIRDIFPEKYARIAAKCLKNNPDGRFANVDELKKALDRTDRAPYAIAASVAAVLAALLIGSGIRKANLETLNLKETVLSQQQEIDSSKAQTEAALRTADSLRSIIDKTRKEASAKEDLILRLEKEIDAQIRKAYDDALSIVGSDKASYEKDITKDTHPMRLFLKGMRVPAATMESWHKTYGEDVMGAVQDHYTQSYSRATKDFAKAIGVESAK